MASAGAGAEDRVHSRFDVVAVSLEVFARFITTEVSKAHFHHFVHQLLHLGRRS